MVPNLKGKTLAAAKQSLSKGKCRLGTVGYAFSGRVAKGRAISQKPRAGGRLTSGAKVSIVLSKGRRR